MSQGRKIGVWIRRVLLVLWVLCLGLGICWLFRAFGEKFGVGLIGTPSVGFVGPLARVLDDGDSLAVNLAITFVYLGLFFLTQWFFLSPRHIWKIKTKSKGRPMKWAAIGAGFAITLLMAGLLYSVIDLVWKNAFDKIVPADDDPTGTVVLKYLFLLIPLCLWCLWSVVFYVYRSQSDYYNWAGRVIRGLIGGTILELLVTVPIYVTRQEDCYCARGSYAGLVFGGTAILWAFGPGVALLFIREKLRREKLLESQNKAQ
jgi:hypothetical protein